MLGDFVMDIQEPFGEVTLDLTEFVDMLGTGNEALLDRLDVLFTHGELSLETRNAILSVMADVPDPEFRARIAIYLVLVSPDYAVSV